ncbi:MAG: polysaccharide deacetylase family protein [Clostridia bacterium]|nr:polysaccharide deacetylase family protein [Clostridia bacterium]
MKKYSLSICTIFLLLLFSMNISASALSWYCKRNNCHTQPELGNDLKIAENYDVYWCDKNHTSMLDDDKVIYLTFDAGYENGNVEKILDALKAENVTATFFILDNMIIKNCDIVKRMIEEGHTVANHTLKHKDMSKITNINDFENELSSLEKLFEKEFGVKMAKYYRPPEGKFTEANLKYAQDLGYKTIMWSFAYADWDNSNQPSCEYALNKILNNVHNGEVMLLHPTSATNAEIMPALIKELKKQGFRFGDMDELCAF